MKKALLLVIMFLFIGFVAGCGKKPSPTPNPNPNPSPNPTPNPDFNPGEAMAKLNAKYASANCKSFKVTIVIGEQHVALDYILNRSGTEVTSFKAELIKDGELSAAYVREQRQYSLVNGKLTSAPFDMAQSEEFLAEYDFDKIISTALKTFDNAYFAACVVKSQTADEVQLEWNPALYSVENSELGLKEAEALINSNEAMDVVLTLKAGQVTKLHCDMQRYDKKVASYEIEYRGAGIIELPIEYPAEIQ